MGDVVAPAVVSDDDWPNEDEWPLEERESLDGPAGAGTSVALPSAIREDAEHSRSSNGSALTHAAVNGSVPPQNLEAEESVLGAMMISPAAIAAVSEIVDPADFYRESHARIYRAALALYQAGEPVDAITLTHELEERGHLEAAGGRVRLHELANLVPAAGNAAHYATIVKESALMRGLIRAGAEIVRLGHGGQAGSASDHLERASELVYGLATGRAPAGMEHGGDTVTSTFQRIQELHESGSELIGVSTGFRDIDRTTCGLEPGQLIVIAARPSMGKSGLAIAIAGNVAIRQRTPVAIFSAEMSKSELVQRFLAREAHVDGTRIRTGKVNPDDWPRLAHAANTIQQAPLYYRDLDVTLLSIRSDLRRLKQREPGLGLAVVDYIQLLDEDAENRTQAVSKISRGLKLIARDIGIPVIALSQLSRAVELRADKRPILSDLRESGSIEQDADVVMFLYRDGYYNPEAADQTSAELNVAKQRNGPTDRLHLAFVKEQATFTDQHRAGMVG